MIKNKPLTARLTEDQYNLLLEFGTLSAGLDAIFDSYSTMRELARADIKKQKFTAEEIKALGDPMSRRVNLSFDDDMLRTVCGNHNINPDDLKKKLEGLGAIGRVFFSDEFRVYGMDRMVEMYSVSAKKNS